mmetsp:Transcript_8459/g.16178  ORF Transcript_8459/g.16178 Transcript_8459/m.16178 type:complete len:258 (-) Transcript_8459:10-783(-)
MLTVTTSQTSRCLLAMKHRTPLLAVRRVESTLTTSASSKTSSPAQRFLRWYSGKLETYPLLTKGITGGLIAGAGDILCQTLQNQNAKNKSGDYDWWRTARFSAVGAFYIAPGIHYWYGALASKLAPGQTTAAAVAKRVAADQFLFAPPFIASILSLLWWLEEGPQQGSATTGHDDATTAPAALSSSSSSFLVVVSERLSATLPDIVMANWIVWIPAQIINFGFVPLHFQVLFNNALGLFWNAYLSYSSSMAAEEIVL